MQPLLYKYRDVAGTIAEALARTGSKIYIIHLTSVKKHSLDRLKYVT